jgi:hypothetical protein
MAVTNPTPTLTPNHNPNSNLNRINKKIQKETIVPFAGWKIVLTQVAKITRRLRLRRKLQEALRRFERIPSPGS